MVKEMQKSGTDTHNLALAAQSQSESFASEARATEQIAHNAEKSLNATQDSFRLDQRAWVGAIEAMSPQHLAVGQKATLGWLITNSGKTPAPNVSDKIASWAFLTEQPFYPVWSPLTSAPSVTVIQPGMKVSMWTPPQLRENAEANINRLKNRDEILYVYGEVAYDDIFHQRHCTHFCGYVAPDLTTINSCGTYNDAD